MSSHNKRRDIDVTKLMMSDYVVEPINEGIKKFTVIFHGPKESPYEGGIWKVRVVLPDDYPYEYPRIRFLNRIFHPNVDEHGGVCLDVIKESWSPMFDLLNVFEVFLPQLLLYPNPSSPLNESAADLMVEDNAQYELKVKEYCERYAKKEHIDGMITDEGGDGEDSDDEEYNDGLSDHDNEVAGPADPEYCEPDAKRDHIDEMATADGEESDDEDYSDGQSDSDDEVAGHPDP